MRRRTSKITNPMTPIGPLPFVGRQNELAELKQHLSLVSLVSLHGALGSGKTRLVTELAPTLGAPTTALGRIVVVGRDPLSAAVGSSIAELELHGLDVESAGGLWASLEEQFGAVEGFDAAF